MGDRLVRIAVSFALCALLGAVPALAARPAGPPSAAASARRLAQPHAAQVEDMAQSIDVNNLKMDLTNFGAFAYDIANINAEHGMFFPKGTTRGVVFASGLWLGATLGGTPHVTVSEYDAEYEPGRAAGGVPESPLPAPLKVYKLLRSYPNPNQRDGALADYNAGAAPRGAPVVIVKPDGSLSIPGDEMCWCVFNDLDPLAHDQPPGGTDPLQVEVQQTTWAFNLPPPLGNTEILQFKIINRGANPLNDLYLGIWSDPDVGGNTDDVVGCDTTRSLGYAYNANHVDAQYLSQQPAVGYDLLQGPFSAAVGHRLPMTAFFTYVSGADPVNATQSFCAMHGQDFAGNTVLAPGGAPTRFMYSGDPVGGTGWVLATGADRIMLMSSGPFTMAAGSSQTVTLAIIVAQGANRLASVDLLRTYDDQAQAEFDAGTLGVLGVPGATGRGLALDRVFPNPARDDLSLAFSLPGPGDVTVEVVDVAGRRVARRVVQGLGAGPHVLSFTGVTTGTEPGVYFVRLSHDHESVTKRVALTR